MMDINSDLKIISFNCCGVINKLPVIKKICEENDIVLLQETWLMPYNVGILDSVHRDFSAYSTSAVDCTQALIGRPYGGLSILWRKSLGSGVNIESFDDNRILGIDISVETRILHLLNIYLPYYSAENYDLYLDYIGKISSIIESREHSDSMVLGDFNAQVNGYFYREWATVCQDYELVFADVTKLPQNTCTHINHSSLTATWIDHCLTTQSVYDAITHLSVDDSYHGSDHFPMCVTLSYRSLPAYVITEEDARNEEINWNFRDDQAICTFYRELSRVWGSLDHPIRDCNLLSCQNPEHKTDIVEDYDKLSGVIKSVGRQVFGIKVKSKNRIIPGWNDYIKDFYEHSRAAFLAWKRADSPRDGPIAHDMRRARAQFKLALRDCKRNEKSIRAEKILSTFQGKRMQDFWKLIKKIDNNPPKLPQRIDNANSEIEICNLWRNKYNSLLNSVQDCRADAALQEALRARGDEQIPQVTAEEVALAAGNLSSNKSIGLDGIPAEVFKCAPTGLYHWIAAFISRCLTHSFMPVKITDVLIVPILKNSQKNPSDSGSYRPIAIASAISKIFEAILLTRLEYYLQSSSHQFGFKKSNSTETCIFAIKETINYYKTLNTDIFACFIDVKGAFDRVNYVKLFIKMTQRGTPKYIVQFLIHWYRNQQLFIKWGNSMSTGFGMTNGIRQGSKLSPHLFNLYIDELNHKLCNSKIGCHIAGEPANNYGYADDLALLAPSAKALDKLLAICDNYATDNDIIFSTEKSVCMLIHAGSRPRYDPPRVWLSNAPLQYVESFKYLGHIISTNFKDDLDILRELKSLNVRGNIIVRKFGFLQTSVKCDLFKTYCYPMYTCGLWSNFNQATLKRLKVAYNNIMRRLMYVPPWQSASRMFGTQGVRSFDETIRITSFSLLQRVDQCPNDFIECINGSDAARFSCQRLHWHTVLH